MNTAISAYRPSEAGFGSLKSVFVSALWFLEATVAASRVAAAVRSHQRPVAADLEVLGLEAEKFPRF